MDRTTSETLRAKEKEKWEIFAHGYSEIVLSEDFMPEVHEQFVKIVVPAMEGKAGAVILDIAAASGEPGMSLAKLLPSASVIATDIAETYLPLGTARAERAEIKNITFQQADGQNLSDFADASCDAVTCSLGLMFFPEEKEGLAGFYRVLKPGGLLMVAVWASTVPFFTVAADVAKKVMPPTPDAPLATVNQAMRFGDAKGLCEVVKAVGFEGVYHRQVEITFRLPGGEQGQWWNLLWKTPFPLKMAVMQAKAAGRENAEEEAKALLEAAYRECGAIKPDHSVAMSGNFCNFIVARKPE